MGVCNASGQPKPAAERLFAWATRGVGVCEWVYWREAARFEQMVALLRQLGIRRVRTGIGSRGPVPSPRKSPDSPGRLR
jgi:hypothetical protein